MLFTRNLKFLTGFLFLVTVISCSKDEDSDNPPQQGDTYNTEVFITDSPIDNAEVEGVFVTVSNVKVNGKSLEGFQKTTLEISSLTNGQTALLGEVDLEAGTTSSISLSLDSKADASGNVPGSYVLLSDGEKQPLNALTGEVFIQDEVEIAASDENELVLDFDLRKLITMTSEGTYSTVPNIDAQIRAVNTIAAGTIEGTVDNVNEDDSEVTVVYAYGEGDFDEGELEENENGVRFSNAISSSLVSNSTGEFSLHFLRNGQYELHFVNYSDTDGDGNLEVQGEAEISTSTGINLNSVPVTANSTTTLELSIEGLLNL